MMGSRAKWHGAANPFTVTVHTAAPPAAAASVPESASTPADPLLHRAGLVSGVLQGPGRLFVHAGTEFEGWLHLVGRLRRTSLPFSPAMFECWPAWTTTSTRCADACL